MSTEEREWITRGLAWVGLRRWMCGEADAERAQVWFHSQIARRFWPSSRQDAAEASARDEDGNLLGPGLRSAPRHITPDMERLLCEMQAGLSLPPELTYHAGQPMNARAG